MRWVQNHSMPGKYNKSANMVRCLGVRIFVIVAIFAVINGPSLAAEAVNAEEGNSEGNFNGFDGGVLRRGIKFLIEPEENYYVVKNKPATITCKALGAVHISFKCANTWIKQHKFTTTMSVDQVTQKKIIETSITVTKEEVEDYFGSDDYWCQCFASDQPPEIKGRIIVESEKRGLVELAYLKRLFDWQPYKTRVELNQQTVLRCLPPEGKPLPEVFWLKDGNQIDVQNNHNFIISREGNLIINWARLEDSGNYTCGAQNIVARRLSIPTPFVVYVNGGWSTWSQWTKCSAVCGRGTQRRQRTCTNPAPQGDGDECPGEAVQNEACNIICPANGNWAEWSSWSACMVTCGNASQTRTRPCTNPPPESHGKDCEGSNEDFKQCVFGPCPVDGNWTDWSTWSACAITCGNTTQTRTRTCTNPPPSHNGTDCQGTSEDYQPCVREPCPVDGNWTDWSSWSACSVTCGSATQSRIRTCTNPPPTNNGTECEDSSEDYKSCVHEPCRGWGQWSEWGSCSSTCGVGMQHRNRSCYTPIYTSIDDLCIGDYTDVQICMSRACTDGGWSTWSPWSTCSASCFGGNRKRYRGCTNPPPSPFGQPCVGQSLDVDSCNTYDCTVGGWSDWSSWGSCTASCLGGNHQRRRECTNPSPSSCGRPCDGPSVETDSCNTHDCEESSETERGSGGSRKNGGWGWGTTTSRKVP